MNNLKILAANTASWIGTIVSMQVFKEALQVVALLGSIAVSLGSLWWIKQQAKALERQKLK